MAIPDLAIGDIVTPHTSVTPAPGSAAVNGQIQMRGVVAKANGAPVTDVDVLWDSGVQEAAIPHAALDRIEAPDLASQALQGQVVRRVLTPGGITVSAAYDGLVIELYKRANTASDTVTADIALTKTLQGATLFETFAAALEIVPGR